MSKDLRTQENNDAFVCTSVHLLAESQHSCCQIWTHLSSRLEIIHQVELTIFSPEVSCPQISPLLCFSHWDPSEVIFSLTHVWIIQEEPRENVCLFNPFMFLSKFNINTWLVLLIYDGLHQSASLHIPHKANLQPNADTIHQYNMPDVYTSQSSYLSCVSPLYDSGCSYVTVIFKSHFSLLNLLLIFKTLRYFYLWNTAQ